MTQQQQALHQLYSQQIQQTQVQQQPPQPISNFNPSLLAPTVTRQHVIQTATGGSALIFEFKMEDLQRDFPALSKGSYGTIYTGQMPGRSEKVVIKDMHTIDEKSVKEWKKEILTMIHYTSPYICQVYGYAANSTHLTIVMEYMANGDLFHLLHKVRQG
eukprot:TRINITY_DN9186_c0_g1_i1.p2 TRINITY_DN9186_c0_g1~~TRINITY_DN9186_c0_g1_i1.p2  ORF type:complete len:179 (-),score=59.35 TRINITY_DN9186_c0_g1_i1:925-1401(-)